MERYQAMTPSSESPNPLRPYYKPPSIGLPASAPSTNTTSPQPPTGPKSTGSPSFGSSAREILSDLDYDGFLAGARPSTAATVKRLFDQAVWKYSSVFLAHPFDVAKTVLQCHLAERLESTPSSSRRAPASRRYQDYTASEESDDDDASSYFTSSHPNHRPYQGSRTNTQSRAQSHLSSPSRRPDPSSSRPNTPPYRLVLRKGDSISEVLSQLWSKEGAWGFWKGTNISFIYSILLKGIETWTRSMLAALFNLPDPGLVGATGSIGGLDIIDSPSPFTSLVVSICAAGLAGVILAPLDIARTRLILTPVTTTPRSIIATLRTLPSYIIPAPLLTPTLLHSTLPTIVSSTTPLFLRANLGIDPILTPTSYSICTFMASTVELFIRLPIETVLRRGQLQEVARHEQTLAQLEPSRGRQGGARSRRRHSPTSSDEELNQLLDDDPLRQSTTSTLSSPVTTTGKLKTIVEVGPYSGLVATMWRIAREEGESLSKTQAVTRSVSGAGALPQKRRGQGMHGLWRGWRVGFWGLVGVWFVAGVGSASGGRGEF